MISTVSHSKSCLYFHDLAVFLCWLHKNVSCRIADTDLHYIRLIAFEAHQDFMTFRSFFKFQNKRKTQLIFTVHPPWTLMEHFSIQLRGPGLPTALHRRRVSTKTQEYQKATCLKTFLEMFKFFWKKKSTPPENEHISYPLKNAGLVQMIFLLKWSLKKVTCWFFLGRVQLPLQSWSYLLLLMLHQLFDLKWPTC